MKPWHYAALLLCLLAVPAGVAVANHVGDGINRIPVLVSNNTGGELARLQVPFTLSSQTLVDGSYMAADALDADLRDGVRHVGAMPGTGRVQLLACVNDAGGSETAACNSAAVDDMTLPAADTEVYEFAFDNQARHLWLNISTPAVADWTVQWQYWNGTSYVALGGVADGTDHFHAGGLVRVSWDFPAAGQWPESTLHSIAGYWVRAEVTSASSVTTAPQGAQGWYETGRWWTFAETLGTNEQRRFDLHLDTAQSRDFHHFFPHQDGVTVGDAAGLELGDTYHVEVKGYFDTRAGAGKKIVYKEDAFQVTIGGDGIILVQVFEAAP